MKVAIGMDIGGTNTKFVLAGEDGRVIHSGKSPTPQVEKRDTSDIDALFIRNLQEFLDDEKTREALADNGGSTEIAGIGIGIAGLVDRRSGAVLQSPNIAAANGLPLKEIFEKAFSMPVVMENDANVYAFGEKWVGAGTDMDNFIVLTLGTGLGGGLIYGGVLYEGPMEVGHMIIEPKGRFCTCGSYGCLESYASGRAIVDRVVTALEGGINSSLSACCDGNFYKMTPEFVYQSALDGDSLAREVLREVGRYLGIGIANLVNILNIDAVIIGGGLVGAWDMFIEELTTEAKKAAFKPLVENLRILRSALTKEAGAIGAAGFLFNKISGVSA
jgi:glucokinase